MVLHQIWRFRLGRYDRLPQIVAIPRDGKSRGIPRAKIGVLERARRNLSVHIWHPCDRYAVIFPAEKITDAMSMNYCIDPYHFYRVW